MAKTKYWWGTVTVKFDDLDADDREELEEKIYSEIEKKLPFWAHIKDIEVEDYE